MRSVLHVTIACVLAFVLLICVDLSQGSSFQEVEERLAKRAPVSSAVSPVSISSIPTSFSSSPTTAVLTVAPSSSFAPSGSVSGSGQVVSATPTPAASSNNYTGLPTSASFGPTVYPASISWITPLPDASSIPLYKVGSNVTFSWGYTNLLVAPVNMTIAAVAASQTWTISVMQGVATSAVWNLASASATQPLFVASYTIVVNDQRGVSKVYPSGGWLYPDHQLTIGIYTTQPYLPATDPNSCPTCFLGGSDSFRSLREAMLPLATTMGIAGITAGMFLWGMFY